MTHLALLLLVASASTASAGEGTPGHAAAEPAESEPAPAEPAPVESPVPAPPPPRIPPGPPRASPPPADGESPAAVSPASPPAADRFGDQGAIALTGSLSASLSRLGYSSSPSSSTSLSIQPAFDYFSSDGVSEGLSVFFRYSEGTSGIDLKQRTISYGATANIGANLWLGGRASFWPKLSLGAWQMRTTIEGSSSGAISINGIPFPIGTEATENAVFAQIYAPFLFHLASHFFVGIGPDVYADILNDTNGRSNKRRFFGLSTTVGGWF